MESSFYSATEKNGKSKISCNKDVSFYKKFCKNLREGVKFMSLGIQESCPFGDFYRVKKVLSERRRKKHTINLASYVVLGCTSFISHASQCVKKFVLYHAREITVALVIAFYQCVTPL